MYRRYTSFVATINLLTDSLDTADNEEGAPCRQIVPDSTGNITVTRALDGVQLTIPVTAGVAAPIAASTIVPTGTTITGCTVYW